MKQKNRLIYLIISILITGSVTAQVKLYGSYWTGSKEMFTSMDMATGTFSDAQTLTNVYGLSVGESTFDPNNGLYIRSTNLGITIVDIYTGAITAIFSNPKNVKGIEYDPVSSKLYGSYWTGTEEIFTSMDMTTGIFTDINPLIGVNVLSVGESTFDSKNGLYIRSTNLGITIVDIHTGSIVESFLDTNHVKGLEYDPVSSKLYGSYWAGTEEIFTSMDMTTGIFTDINPLIGVNVLSVGESTFDPKNGLYIKSTNLGITIVDIHTGSIVESFLDTNRVKGLEFQYCVSSGTIPIVVSNASICESDSSLLSVSGFYNSYLWSNGETTSSIYVSDSSYYSVLLTNKLDCENISDTVSVNIFDCSSLIDSLMYSIDTCLVNSETVLIAFVDNISITNDTIYVNWNFVTSDGDTLRISANYSYSQNGVYSININFSCDGEKNQIISYFDLIEISGEQVDVVNKSSLLLESIYPNPTKDIVSIRLNSSLVKGYAEVYSVQGQLIKTVSFLKENDLEIDLTHFELGTYFIKLYNDNENKTFKVIKN